MNLVDGKNKSLEFLVSLTEEEFADSIFQKMPALGPGPFDFLILRGSAADLELLPCRTPRDIKEVLKAVQSQVYVRPRVRYISVRHLTF